MQPGQTVDALMDWRDVEHWNAATNPIPTQIPAITDQLLVGTDTWFSESPYLGTKNALPAERSRRTTSAASTTTSPTATRSQQATNYGATFGGMMTVFRIDPPAGCPAN